MATAILALEHGELLDMAAYCEVMFDKETSGEVPEHRDFVYNKMIPWLEGNGVPVYVVRGNKTYLDWESIEGIFVDGKLRRMNGIGLMWIANAWMPRYIPSPYC